jgi:hypothetical protein
MIDDISCEDGKSSIRNELLDCFIHTLFERSRRIARVLAIGTSWRVSSSRLISFREWPAAYRLVALCTRSLRVELVNMNIRVVNDLDRVSSTWDWALSLKVIRGHGNVPFLHGWILAKA